MHVEPSIVSIVPNRTGSGVFPDIFYDRDRPTVFSQALKVAFIDYRYEPSGKGNLACAGLTRVKARSLLIYSRIQAAYFVTQHGATPRFQHIVLALDKAVRLQLHPVLTKYNHPEAMQPQSCVNWYSSRYRAWFCFGLRSTECVLRNLEVHS